MDAILGPSLLSTLKNNVPGHRVESTPPPGPVPIPMQPPPWLSQQHVHPSTQQQIVFRPPPPIPVHSANPFHERWRTNLNPVFTHLENNGHTAHQI
ncbi:hypothetical protein M8J77_009870 [Diaphorina citri]|nr:hypothetical protein M8J77_009870 [Diaphorina citri]